MPRGNEQDGRLVILGGGIAALTTAFYASELGHERVFPGGIHVYEMTDALGGKGASRRTTTKNIEHRIEEHGLHVWFGFYDNAFWLLRRCHEYLENEATAHGYERWGSALRDIDQGFRPCSRIAAVDFDGASWVPWVADFPEDSTERPWHVRSDDPGFAKPTALAARALRLAETFLYSVLGRPSATDPPFETILDPSLVPLPFHLPKTTGLWSAVDQLLSQSVTSAASLEILSTGLRVLAAAATEVRNRLDEPVRRHPALRRTWYLVDLLLAAVRGLIDDGVLSTGRFELIDGIDLRGWLALHGASEESVSCGLLKALVYDVAFAYEDGNPARPSCSAATGVEGLLRVLLTYRGALMWKMNAGMGEIVFAPIYEALLRRGVEFHFGHRVESVVLSGRGERRRATRITFREGSGTRQPGRLQTLVVDDGKLAGTLPHWGPPPAVDPDARSRRLPALALGRHDMVVYGLPVGTISGVVRNPPEAWATCAREVRTVATAALQVWLDVPVTRYAPWATPDVTLGGYTEPFDTWADMKVLSGERSADPERHNPRSVAYFTNVAPGAQGDPTPSQHERDRWIDDFLDHGLTGLWPEFDRNSMVIEHYPRFNYDPSSRYTLSLPGSLSARLSPSNDQIVNLRAVGDWTRNGINGGCIEAAVISGMIAARDLRPDRSITIVGQYGT